MAKIKKVKLPKNKILILLTLILALSICLLSLTIIKGNSVLEPEYEETYAPVATDTPKEEQKVPQATGKILRSSNGNITVLDRNDPVQNRASSLPAPDADESAFPSVTADAETTQTENQPSLSLETTAAYAAAGMPVAEDGITIKRFTVTAEDAAAAAAKANDGSTFSVVPEKGTLIFVFDDAGHNVQQLQPFLELPFPVTIAVLPGLEYSSQVAQRARKAGKEVILHQPMQAQNLSVDPGPRAITPDMSADQVRSLVMQNIADISPISGMNNHEGSLITTDKALLSAVLSVCKAEGLYFIDSRTTAQSVARQVSVSQGQKIWERSVFLDNSQDKAAIIAEVRRGMELASKNGMAIMIGHVWTDALPSILLELYPEMLMQGFKISTISQL